MYTRPKMSTSTTFFPKLTARLSACQKKNGTASSIKHHSHTERIVKSVETHRVFISLASKENRRLITQNLIPSSGLILFFPRTAVKTNSTSTFSTAQACYLMPSKMPQEGRSPGETVRKSYASSEQNCSIILRRAASSIFSTIPKNPS